MAQNKLLFSLSVFLCLAASLGRKSCPPVEKCIAALEKGKPCPLVPVPKTSLPLPTAEKGFNVTQLRPGVHRYDDGFYSSLIVSKKDHLVLIDFPDSSSSFGPDGKYLLTEAVSEVLKESVPKRLDMIYGHRHTDHIGGASLLKGFAESSFPGISISVWGTSETKSFIQRSKRPDIPLPNVVVGNSGRRISLSKSLNLKLKVVGGHVNSDIAAHVVPSTDGPGVLHYVDVLTPGAVPFLQFAVTIDLEKYIKVQRDLLKLDYKVFNAGHGLLGTKRDVRINIRYTNFVIKAAAEAIENADQDKINEFFARRLDPNAVEFGNTQYAFGNIYWLWRDACVRKTIEKWGCKLAGVDLFSPSHCISALIFNNIDNHRGFSL